MQIQLKIKILQKNYVYHRLNFTVQVRENKKKAIIIYFILVLAEDAIKAAIHDYNTKKNKQQK